MACLPTLSRRTPEPSGLGTREALKNAQERLQQLGFYAGAIDGIFGQKTEQAVEDFQQRRDLAADGIIGPDTWGALYDDSGPVYDPVGYGQFHVEALTEIAQCPRRRAERFADPLRQTFAKYDIKTTLRISHFLAQVLHESARLRYTEEIWGPTAAQRRYEGRSDLGNVQEGDGYRYRGRGLIQLTGRANYADYNRVVEENVVQNPDLVAELPLAADVAGWFWADRGLNAVADRDDVRRVTRVINGGLNGFQDRKKLLQRAKRVLQVEQAAA